MAASSQSMEQQILQSAEAQLTGYLSRWNKHYGNEVQQIMTDLHAGQDTPAPLAFARLLNALFAIPVSNPESALQDIRRSISQSLPEVDGEGNNLPMLAARDCHEAFIPLLQAVNHPLFTNKNRLLLQKNTHDQTLLDLALGYYTNHPSIQVQIEIACLSEAGRIAVVRQTSAQLLSGNYQSVDLFVYLRKANPEAMNEILAELAIRCDSMLKQKSSNAMTLRAYMHGRGWGGPVNYPEAINLYERAIALDNARSMYIRATMHHNGEGGPVNYPEAIRLYRLAAGRGIQEAVRALTFSAIQRYINNHPDAWEGPAIASSSSARASAPELGESDIAFVKQKIRELIDIGCDSITGTRDSICIQLSIGSDRIPNVKTLVSMNPVISIKFVSTDGDNFQVEIKNIGYEAIRTLVKQDKPELEVAPENPGGNAAPNAHNPARLWSQSGSAAKQPTPENINTSPAPNG